MESKRRIDLNRGKLIRDGYLIEGSFSGKRDPMIILDREQKVEALLQKINEEREEVRVAYIEKNRELLKEELGDLIEIVAQIGAEGGISLIEILEYANKKREKKGGFDKGVFLIKDRD